MHLSRHALVVARAAAGTTLGRRTASSRIITPTDPTVARRARGREGVTYADGERARIGRVEVGGGELTVSRVRENGATPFSRTLAS